MADIVPQFVAAAGVCSNNTEGQPCFWEYGGKGGVIYSEYDSCSRATILLPGFNLLPDWLLASTKPLPHARLSVLLPWCCCCGWGCTWWPLRTQSSEYIPHLLGAGVIHEAGFAHICRSVRDGHLFV